jgi:hypothetical protein
VTERAAVAGGPAGDGCGGRVVLSVAAACPSSSSPAGDTAPELLPLLFFLPLPHVFFSIAVLTELSENRPGGRSPVR